MLVFMTFVEGIWMRSRAWSSRGAGALLAVCLLAGACGGGPQRAGTRETPGPTTTAAAGRDGGPVQPGARLAEFPVDAGAAPHDVAPARDGGVWFTAQGAGYLGHLEPSSGKVTRVPLGDGSRPHGVITAADGTAWVTDGGLNAIVRVDAATRQVRRYPLPPDRAAANLNTATIAGDGSLWFTGQAGIYGRLDPRSGRMRVYDAPEGRGPYGIATTPNGDVYYASLAGSHIARIDQASGRATVIRPPTAGQGARRVWADSRGRLWVSEWNAGQLGRYDPASGRWQEWRLPGDRPMPYAVYVDDRDQVWLSDFGANRLVRFDPATERFTTVELPGPAANVRQILGRPGELLGAASALDRLLILRTQG
jgi:virginiamycin B lyase